MNKVLFVFLLMNLNLSYGVFATDSNSSEGDDIFQGMVCPGDRWVECGEELWDLKIYGNAHFKDYNKTITLYNPEEKWHLNECNTGYITRTWRHKAYGKWHKCVQTIHVGTGGSDSKIFWPKDDLVLEGCNPNILPQYLPNYYDEPKFHNEGCDMLVKSYKDQIFSFGGGCKKLVRKWTVINWCEYKPNSWPKKGYYEHIQTIKIVNNKEPHGYDNPMTEVKATDCKGTYVTVPDLHISGDECGGGYKITHDSRYAKRSGADASGTYPVGTHVIHYKVEYGCGFNKTMKQSVRVVNKTAPVPICLSGLSVALMPIDENNDGIVEDGEVSIWAKDFDFKSYSPCDLPLTFSFSPTELVMSKSYNCSNVGVNKLTLYTSDSNGNQSSCNVELRVQNNAANIPNCEPEEQEEDEHQDEPVDDGGADVDSTGAHMDSSMYTMDTLPAQDSIVSPDSTVVMDSILIDSTQVDVEVDSTHSSGDTTIVDSSDVALVYGSLISAGGDAMLGSQVRIEVAGQVAYDRTVATDVSGGFLFSDVPRGQMVSVSPAINTDLADGKINTADGIILFEHLTGINRIQDPYQLLAADVDGDDDIDFDDVEFLVDYITGQIDALPSTPWLYVNAAHNFEGVQAPWAELFEEYDVMIDQAVNKVDFVAIQVGNVGDVDLETRSDINDLKRKISEFRGETQQKLSIQPNPFTLGFSLTLHVEQSQNAELKLYSIDGRLLHQQAVYLAKGTNKTQVNLGHVSHTGAILYQLVTDAEEHKGKLLKLK